MGSGGGGSSPVQTNYVRFADYIEKRHKSFLTRVDNYAVALDGDSPFDSFVAINPSDAFFGTGSAITGFNALFDNYETYLQDFDHSSEYNTVFANTVNSQTVKDLVVAEGAYLSDEVETNSLPRITAGMRDLGAVMSSSFITAKTNLEATRLKVLTKFSTEIKARLIPVAVDRWKTVLNWNKNIVTIYAELFKLYYATKLDTDNHNYTMFAKDTLWPFTVHEYERAALGALQGARTETAVGGESGSTAQKVLGGALGGASLGASIGGPVGAGIGAAIGGIAGAF